MSLGHKCVSCTRICERLVQKRFFHRAYVTLLTSYDPCCSSGGTSCIRLAGATGSNECRRVCSGCLVMFSLHQAFIADTLASSCALSDFSSQPVGSAFISCCLFCLVPSFLYACRTKLINIGLKQVFQRLRGHVHQQN